MPANQTQPAANDNCQITLARELLACLGRDSAIHACKVNGWAGVLDVLLAEPPCHARDV